MFRALFNFRSVGKRVVAGEHKDPRESMHYTSEKFTDSNSNFLIFNAPVSLGHYLILSDY